MSTPHKDCQHLLAQITDYLDGVAPETVCQEIEEHIATCEDCRVVVDTLSQTIHLYENLPQPDFPDGMRQRLYKSLDLTAFMPSQDD